MTDTRHKDAAGVPPVRLPEFHAAWFGRCSGRPPDFEKSFRPFIPLDRFDFGVVRFDQKGERGRTAVKLLHAANMRRRTASCSGVSCVVAATCRPSATKLGILSSAKGAIFTFRFIAFSMKGASSSCLRLARASSRASNSGNTSRANSSRDWQIWSCRFLPPCWIKAT
jgi:hypothetical protein